MRTNIADYGLADTLSCPFDKTMVLAQTKTRLRRLDTDTQERLINWGYAVCDAAMRRRVEPAARPPATFPFYPRSGSSVKSEVPTNRPCQRTATQT